MPIVQLSKAKRNKANRPGYFREYQKKHRDRLTEQNRRWRDRHRPIFRIRNAFRRRWKWIMQPEYWHAYKRKTHLKKHYGIGPAEYEALFQSQKGVCAICGKPEWRTNRTRYLSVDHEHGTTPPKVRGLLCHGCNMALGCVQDDVQTLRNMIAYLEKHAPDK